MADRNTTGRKSAPPQPPAGRRQSVAPASIQSEPTGPMLYEHPDGRYAIAPRADLASFTRGDPGWTRLGRISIVVPAVEPAAGDRCDKVEAHLTDLYQQAQAGKVDAAAAEGNDAALVDAMQALAEAEALFAAIITTIGCGQGDPDSLAEVGRRLTGDAHAKADQASIDAANQRDTSEVDHV